MLFMLAASYESFSQLEQLWQCAKGASKIARTETKDKSNRDTRGQTSQPIEIKNKPKIGDQSASDKKDRNSAKFAPCQRRSKISTGELASLKNENFSFRLKFSRMILFSGKYQVIYHTNDFASSSLI